MLLRVSSRCAAATRPHSSVLGTSAFSSVASPAAAAVESSISAAEAQQQRRRRERQDQPVAFAIEGTAEYYTRQLVVVDSESAAPLNWPAKLEFSDHVISNYAKAVATVESPKHSALRAIAATPFPAPCASSLKDEETAESTAERPHDLLIFPELLRVKDVHTSHVPSLVSELLRPNPNVQDILQSLKLSYAPLDPGYHILVCAHQKRDERCGCKGPELLEWLDSVGKSKDIPVHLYSSSHFGGHRYAANCIAYPSGDWFGLLNEPQDATAVIEALEDNEPLRLVSQWRGRIATTKAQQIAMLQQARESS